MKSWLLLLVSMLCASVALADSLPAPISEQSGKAVAELIDKQLVQPLAKRQGKRAKFSRAAPPPLVRRVRVQETLLTDVHGQQFVRFSIDQRYGSGDEKWEEDRITGCVYPDQHRVYVESEGDYLPARMLLGQEAKAQADVCVPVPLGTTPSEIQRS